ncbi:unnamed protein product [Fraxinus pennsylvanica]|uniref:Pentatricopeptide repeat-containing protein n=1 Tax=Fraxinus pennsylvanica TaxID=56036 RepID=A0AAD1YWU8_9LAMI|nr:unnamed protein product [Fraxinus pennsylvanica]
MPEKYVVSWTVMLDGLIRERRIDEDKRLYSMLGRLCLEGRLDEAREIFDSTLQKYGLSDYNNLISGCAKNGKVDVVRKLLEVMPGKNEVNWTAMVMGHTQCGRTRELFDAMPVKPVFACNVMTQGIRLHFPSLISILSVCGYAQHGLGRETLQVSQEMCSSGIAVNDVTLLEFSRPVVILD